ncbi:hypothetical protein BLGI_4285 [Brevibacillus laterosporus GI-9]|nr:hypothetical protein BLGI_4285 [Brevibacillus laterosporus GI-9]
MGISHHRKILNRMKTRLLVQESGFLLEVTADESAFIHND